MSIDVFLFWRLYRWLVSLTIALRSSLSRRDYNLPEQEAYQII